MENPSYYAVIPASVRYSKIPPNAKLLYGEITALSQKEGFCYASNAYFASLYDVATTTISEWLKQLHVMGFVKVFVDKEAGNKRKIWIADPIREKPNTSSGNPEDPYSGKAEDNNTSINITSNNNPLTPLQGEVKKAKRNAKSQSTVTEHFGDNPICPAEYANDASRNHGFSQERIDAAFGAFYDHHASKGTKFADHRAAFRTWCRNEVKFAARGSSPTGGGVRDKAAAAVGAVVAMRYGVPSGSQSIGGGKGGNAQAEARDEGLPW